MENWQLIDNAPSDRAIWIIDMDSQKPTAHLAKRGTRAGKPTWRLIPSKLGVRGYMEKPTHFRHAVAPPDRRLRYGREESKRQEYKNG